jgi:hypothetical protein
MELVNSLRRKTYLGSLREFAKNNPESDTAKILLLNELSRLGGIRAAMAIKDAEGILDDSDDLEIWGEFVRVANPLMPQLLLLAMDFEITTCFGESGSFPRGLFHPSGSYISSSQQLQRLAQRQIEPIENALQARPHARELWRLWSIFSPYVPNRSLMPFLETLTPVPELQGFPPTFLYPGLLQNYKALEAWRQIIGLAGPIWESYQSMIDAGQGVKHRLTRELWSQYVAPLCEAYEKIGMDSKAEKIRADWKKADGWR